MKRKKSPFNRIVSLVVIGVGLIAVGAAAMALLTLRQPQAERESGASVVPAAVDYPAPALSLTDLDGNPRSLADYRGQVALVNLWATWCPPCVAELPALNSFYLDHAGQGFVVIGVNDGEEAGVVRDFVAGKGLTFPVWLDPSFLSENAFNTMNLPSSYVIDRDGRVCLRWVGGINLATLEKYVTPIIKE